MNQTGSSDRVESLAVRVGKLSLAAREQLAGRLEVAGADETPAYTRSSREHETLVAYYVTKSGTGLPREELRGFLGRALPDHLVPAVFSRIDRIPRTNRGKVDKTSLPDPRPRSSANRAAITQGDEAATPEIERQLLEIWTAVLGADRIVAEDSFFEIGGDSLLGIQLLGRVRDRWRTEITMESLFDHPTLRDMAAYIEAVRWARTSQATGGPDDSDLGDREEIEF